MLALWLLRRIADRLLGRTRLRVFRRITLSHDEISLSVANQGYFGFQVLSAPYALRESLDPVLRTDLVGDDSILRKTGARLMGRFPMLA